MTSASSAGPLSLNVSDDDMDAEKEGQASGSAEDLIMEGDCSAEGDPVWDCRAQINTHFPRGQQMPECTQVLVLNVYWAVRRLSSQEQKQISKSLMGTAGATSVSYVLQVCAALLGFSAARVQRIVESVKRNDWQPCLPRQAPGHEPHGREPGDRESVGDAAVLHTLTRAALSVRAAHGSAREFPRYIARLAMEGVEVGNKYHTPEHYGDIEFLAARVGQRLEARELAKPLAGLGICSDLALLMDGVPLGGCNRFGRHGSVTVLCTNSVSPITHRLHSRFITHCTSTDGHGGEAMASAVLDALSRPPFLFSEQKMRGSLSLVGGDGAAVAGGMSRQKPGTQAGEILWTKVHPHIGDDDGREPLGREPPEDAGDDLALLDLALPPKKRLRRKQADATKLHLCTEWDKFHREDIALARAISKSACASEVYQVCAAVDHMFHYGDGRLLLQTAAEVVDTRVRSGSLPTLTRRAAALASEPGNLLNIFSAYVAGLHGKAVWVSLGHRGHTLETVVELGRRLTSVDL